MPKIDPFVGLFVAIATLNIGMFVWLRDDIARVETGLRADIAVVRGEVVEVRGEVVEVRAVQSEHGERLARIEAVLETVQTTLSEHGARLTRLEDGQGVLRGDLATTNERVARIEGTVAGALGRPFPERLAQAPEAADGADG